MVYEFHNKKKLTTEDLMNKHQELYEDFLLSNFEHKNELQKLKNVIDLKEQEIENLKKEKINKVDIEPHNFKPEKKIEKDELLYSYYCSLNDKLSCINLEAEIITSGNLTLNTSKVKITILQTALNAIPLIGKYLWAITQATHKLVKSNEIKEQAIKIKQTFGKTVDERKNFIFKISQDITVSRTKDILNADENKEVQFWKNNNFIENCRDFFVVNIDKDIHVTDQEILGCIDALKLIYAIVCDNLEYNNIEELQNSLLRVPTTYKFDENKEIVFNSEIKNNMRVSNKSAKSNLYVIKNDKSIKSIESKKKCCCIQICCC